MTTLRKVPLNGSNTNDAIVPFENEYLVRVCGRWRAGTFDRQWYGLNFTAYGSEGIELQDVDEVYEITEDVLDTSSTLPVAFLQDA
jgi:hypothetical protein